jgi:hypothetical protein
MHAASSSLAAFVLPACFAPMQAPHAMAEPGDGEVGANRSSSVEDVGYHGPQAPRSQRPPYTNHPSTPG